MKKISAILLVALFISLMSVQVSARSSLLTLKTVEITDDTEVTAEQRHVEIKESAKLEMDMKTANPKADIYEENVYEPEETVVSGGLKNWFKSR